MKHIKIAIISLIIVLLMFANFLSPFSCVKATSGEEIRASEIPQEDPLKSFQPNVLDYIFGIPLYFVKLLFVGPRNTCKYSPIWHCKCWGRYRICYNRGYII